MINKKTLMLIGGGIAAYYIWKNYIKEDVVATAPVEGETTSGAEGDPYPQVCYNDRTGKNVYCKEEEDCATCIKNFESSRVGRLSRDSRVRF